jgi:hypothetical protein
MNIQELIKEQAASVQDNATNQLLAKKLEEMAAQLRRTQKPKPVSFKEIARSKAARVDRFAKALADGKEKELNQQFEAAGYSHSTVKGLFHKKTPKGVYRVAVRAGEFKATLNNVDVQDWTPISGLETFLKSAK